MTRFLFPLFPLLMVAQPALAAAPTGQAEFAPGTSVPAHIVVNEKIWNCVDGRCTGPAEVRAVALQKACTTLAREVGAVAALTAGPAALTPDAIAKCNDKAGRAPATLAAN